MMKMMMMIMMDWRIQVTFDNSIALKARAFLHDLSVVACKKNNFLIEDDDDDGDGIDDDDEDLDGDGIANKGLMMLYSLKALASKVNN